MLTTSLLPLVLSVALGNNIFRISNESAFINFSKEVRNGTNYSGTTVFLDFDIDFSTEDFTEPFEPITRFQGTFDGQGHTIRNLKVESSSEHVGLFGSSTGLTIKNVVIDSSCTIENSYEHFSSSEHNIQGGGGGGGLEYVPFYMGGIIGYCFSESSPCTIENSVNMGSITFDDNISESYHLSLGGIVGGLYSSAYDSIVKNCANYGSVTHVGESNKLYIGGIVGESPSHIYSIYNVYIQNCFSYGNIYINEPRSTTDPYIGGIIGYSDSTISIDNSVSFGRIPSLEKRDNIGNIAGFLGSGSSLSNCYWSNNNNYDAYGSGSVSTITETAKFDNSFVLNETVSIGVYSGTSLIEAFNAYSDYYDLRDYSYLLLNKDGKNVTFKINTHKGFTLNFQIILLPSLTNEGRWQFDGWYTDNTYSTPFTGNEITGTTELYGKWEENTNYYIISFDTRGGTPVEPIKAQYFSVVNLPNTSTRNGCSINSWETEHGEKIPWNYTVSAHDVTLYAVWSCNPITTPEDFVTFSELVNSGTNFEGSTIFLDSDIDFTGKTFKPIGKNENNFFRGTFDGQGHIISNLKMNISSKIGGVFGYSEGLTIKNVVIDDSCSLMSSHTPSNTKRSSYNSVNTYVGGIIGYCMPKQDPCIIENNINMGSITFNGDSNELHIGGIIGQIYIYTNYKDFFIRNCANYGPLTCSGERGNFYVGGIIGRSEGYSPINANIYNCLNYGDIILKGDSRNSNIGGIIGRSDYSVIENCVSSGRISYEVNNTKAGGIIGNLVSSTYVSNCFWTDDVGCNDAYSSGSSNRRSIDTSKVTLNLTVVDNLNNWTSNSLLNKWVLNPQNSSVTFKINNGKGFTVKSQLILLPDLADNNERNFSGWHDSELLSSPFNSSEIQSNTTLYGMFCGSKYTVTFDANGGNEIIMEMTIECNGTYGTLPNASRADYVFNGWFTERDGGDEIKSGDRVKNFNDHTLYAHWKKNQTTTFTVTYDFNNGTILTKVLNPGDIIEYPNMSEDINFIGWDPEYKTMPEENLTITAQWASKVITIVFGKKDIDLNLTETIKKYTDDPKAIIVPIRDDGETITYIIKFIDSESAESFVENIKNDEELANHIVSIKVDGKEEPVNPSKKDDNTTLLIVIILVVVVVVIAVLLTFLGIFLIRRQQFIDVNSSKRGVFMRIANQNVETIEASAFKTRFKDGDKIYPQDYVPPQNISEALLNAGLDEESAKEASEICQYSAELSKEKGYVTGDFGINDAAAVSLYTFDFGGDRYEINPYRILNKALRSEKNKTEEIVKVRDVLYVLMTALRKLPVVKGVTLYRGIREKHDSSRYEVGSTIVWPGFSSTSPDLNTTKSFLKKKIAGNDGHEKLNDENTAEMTEITEGNAKESMGGTLFIIENGWGYNVQPYSRYPEEEEILMEPEREFEVTDVTDSGDSIIISLKMKNTKVILPEVFGEGHL